MGMLVPDGQYERASGLKSFSGNLITVASPMLAGALMAFGGLELILVIDLVSFLFAAGTLMILVPLKEEVKTQHEKKLGMFEGFVDGIEFLKKERGLLYLMLSMALINFCSRLTYENILAPMILARSGNNTAYGIVSAVLGIGGMIGGVLVTVGKGKRDSLKMIYLSAAFSFFFGDLLLGCGRHVAIWCIAGLAASVPIPFIMAGQNAVIYRNVPKIMQGRIFAVQSIVQYSSIPVGILLGGALADYVFEPFMVSEHVLALMLQKITGSGAGSGMAVMFLCTGMLGFVSSLIGYRNRHIREICRRG